MLDPNKLGPKEPAHVPFQFPWPFPQQQSWFYRLQSNVITVGVFSFAKLLFCEGLGLNRLKVAADQRQTFLALIEDRSRPLITISNHRCVMDDPLVWALFSFREFFRNIARFRYTLAAHDICFTNRSHTWAFSMGRCVPCVRGAGVFQQGVEHCIEVLDSNGWVHMFPEGKVTPSPIRIKWGIARMIADARVPPILLPIWINGMDDVWTETQWPRYWPRFWPRLWPRYRPRFGKTVEVFVGEPVDTAHWLKQAPKKGESELEKRKRLADLVQAELYELGKRVEREIGAR